MESSKGLFEQLDAEIVRVEERRARARARYEARKKFFDAVQTACRARGVEMVNAAEARDANLYDWDRGAALWLYKQSGDNWSSDDACVLVRDLFALAAELGVEVPEAVR